MKKIIYTLLILNLISIVGAAQQSTLKVGDKAPQLAPFKWITGQPVNKFEKGRIYVIEFGATWCAPCAAAIPELSALAEQFKDGVSVASIFVMENNDEPANTTNPKYVSHVERYVTKKAEMIQYAVGVDNPQKDVENNWLKAAGKDGVPYIFVIDKNEHIAWIGSDPKEVQEIIKKIQAPQYKIESIVNAINRKENSKPSFDPFKLLLIEGNGGEEDDFLFRSILTRYDGEIKTGNPDFIDTYRWLDSDSEYITYQNRIQVIGFSLTQLYYLAYGDTISNDVRLRGWDWEFPDTIRFPHRKTSYGKYWHEIILEVDDISPFLWSRKSASNRYNYSLKVPEAVGGNAGYMQAALRNDLRTYFGFDVSVETRMMPYWRLSALDKKQAITKLKSKVQSQKLDVNTHDDILIFKNALTRDIIAMLAAHYGYGTRDHGRLPENQQAAFIDDTNIIDKIDFIFDKRLTFEQMQEYLKGLGLSLSKATKPMKVVVIREPKLQAN